MRFLFIGVFVLTTLGAAPVMGQEESEVALDPETARAVAPLAATESGTDASAVETEAMAPDAEAMAREIDALEPGVPSQVTSANRRVEANGAVMDELDLGATEVTGNQELPKVMYIVPWRDSDPGDLMGRPANTLLDDVLAPIDRNEFLRQVDYYGDLHGDSAED